MKKLMNFLKGLIVLLFFVFLFCVFWFTSKELSGSTLQKPNVNSASNFATTQVPYPPPNMNTPVITITPTLTKIPKPITEPRPISTSTISPTSLPIQSSYDVIWLEDIPEEQGSIIWIADPGDIASRRELVHLKNQVIHEAVQSPDGRCIAFLSSNSEGVIINLFFRESLVLQQLDKGFALTGPIFWSTDSQFISYQSTTNTQNSGKEGEAPIVTLRIYNIQKGALRGEVTLPNPSNISILGWSSENSILFTQQENNASELASKISKINITGLSINTVFSTNTYLSSPNLSIDGSRFIVNDKSRVSIVYVDGTPNDSVITTMDNNIQIQWSNNADELLIGKLEPQKPLLDLYTLNTSNKSEKKIASLPIPGPGNWKLLKLSPDNLWLAADLYQKGLYWIYLPNLYLIPASNNSHRIVFIGWAANPK